MRNDIFGLGPWRAATAHASKCVPLLYACPCSRVGAVHFAVHQALALDGISRAPKVVVGGVIPEQDYQQVQLLS